MLGSMLCGIIFHTPLAAVDAATNFQIAPAMIFAMLFVTFCKVRVSDMRFSKMHLTLLLFQVVMAIATYYLTLPLGRIIAQGTMICFLAPIAMGAVAIGAILGANVASIATYSLICNFAIAIIAPYILATYGNGECTFAQIMARVIPLLVFPFIVAQFLRLIWHKAAVWIGSRQQLSFYMWLLSMIITLARTTSFILDYDGDATLYEQLGLALAALIACIVQFTVGRAIGARYSEPTTAGQSLGQKNTMLAVWLSQAFLTPISSIAPTSYIIWQNIANSLQIYLHDRKKK